MSSTPGNPADELPVLTDILVPGQVAPPLHTTPGGLGAGDSKPTAASWDKMEDEVIERVLKGLQTRIDSVIDQRLRDTISQLLDQSLAGLSAELKVSVRDTLRDVVQRAVAQEISRLRVSKGSSR